MFGIGFTFKTRKFEVVSSRHFIFNKNSMKNTNQEQKKLNFYLDLIACHLQDFHQRHSHGATVYVKVFYRTDRVSYKTLPCIPPIDMLLKIRYKVE